MQRLQYTFTNTAKCIAVITFWSVTTAALAEEPIVNIALTGQAMIRSDLRTTAPDAVPRIRSLLKGDVVFTNLEGVIANPGDKVTDGGRGFLIPAPALDALTTVGFNLLALSNNHAFDLKAVGIETTLREVKQRNIVHAGTGKTLAEATTPAYLQTPHAKVALVASASGLIAPGGNATKDRAGVNELRIFAGERQNEATTDMRGAPGNKPQHDDAQRILQSIRDAKRSADIVIVYQHNHVFSDRAFANVFYEGLSERLGPNSWLQKWVHAEIDAGADIVVMHGAPVLHGIELYKGKPIFYDLGNFIFNAPPAIWAIGEPMAWESVVVNVEWQNRKAKSITLRPIELNYIGKGQPDIQDQYASNEFLHTRGLPSLANPEKGRYILERVAEFSRPFGTKVEIGENVATVRLAK